MTTGTINNDKTWLRSVLRLRALMRKRIYGWQAIFKWRQLRDYARLAILRLSAEPKPATTQKPWRIPRDGRGADC